MTVTAAPADADKAPLLDVAYHHEPYWRPDEGDWIKSLLLFFDGVAVLVPDYMRDRPLFADPTLAQPLTDHGLLHRLSPETLVNQQTAEALTELLDDLLRADAFDDRDRDTAFAEISHSRLGGTGSTVTSTAPTPATSGSSSATLPHSARATSSRPTSTGAKPWPTPQTNSDASPAPPGAAPGHLRTGHRRNRRDPRYGNLIGARLTAASALLGLRRQADPASAYTYLFQAQQHLSAPHRY